VQHTACRGQWHLQVMPAGEGGGLSLGRSSPLAMFAQVMQYARGYGRGASWAVCQPAGLNSLLPRGGRREGRAGRVSPDQSW
jgi:hypothetical protein